MIFREMTSEDYEYLKEHSASRGIFKETPEETEFSFSLEHDGKLLGSGGFRLINKTTAWAWLDLSDNANDKTITVCRVIYEWLDIFVKDKGIKRLQAYVHPDFPQAIRLIQHLGFEYEARLKRFYSNKDALLYRRLT